MDERRGRRRAARWRPSWSLAVVAAIALTTAACSDSAVPNVPSASQPLTSTAPGSQPDSSTTPEPVDTGASSIVESTNSPSEPSTVPALTVAPAQPGDDQIVVDTALVSPLPRGVLGINVPAWISPDIIVDPQLHEFLNELGSTVIRMPGGSWSSEYHWLDCETGSCNWDWAAHPSDFATLLNGTEAQGMWTVSFNGTAQEAAALVAYFNGEVGDERVIGIDRTGFDWGTVGRWAQLRADNGNPEPTPVRYWEIGNEVWGATADAGPECASFGWELVWTCDGRAYMLGDDSHDGYLAFREAMQAVDPTILVGAVGIGGDQGEWGDFGNEVIELGGEAIDFYIVHDYGFDSAPSVEDILARPEQRWPEVIQPVLDRLGESGNTAVAVTEYNLFAGQDGDTDGRMAELSNALYLADMVGQMAASGVQLANHWNLINGETPTGSDYGLIDITTDAPRPALYTYALWGRFATSIAATSVGFDPVAELTAYGGVSDDGTVTVLVINKSAAPISAPIRIGSPHTSFTGVADVLTSSSIEDRTVTFNGVTNPDLGTAPGTPFDASSAFDFEFAPISVTLLTLTPA